MQEKQLYKKLVLLALPIVIQNMVSAGLGMVDTMMLGSLGDGAIASVGLANQYFFSFSMIIVGMASGCSMFITQYFGKSDFQGIRSVIALAMRFIIIFCVPFMAVTLLKSEWVIGFFSDDQELIKLGSQYLRIIGWTIPIYAFTSMLASSLRSIHRTAAPMYASIIALLTNVVGNYILIFGKFGFPQLGIRGAAIATLLSRCVEVSILFAIVYGKKTVVAIGPKDFTSIPKGLAKRYFSACSHVILNDWLYSFASTIYMVAYAHLGKQVLASLNVAGSIQNLLFTVISGIAMASSILVGEQTGQSKTEESFWVGQRCLRFSIFIGVINAMLLFLISPIAPTWFGQEAATYNITVSIVRIYALVLVVRFVNYVLAGGVLRGGGDTQWVMIVELSTVWFIAVPFAFLGVYVLKWQITGVVCLVMIEEVVKCVFMLWRFYRRRWVNNVTI